MCETDFVIFHVQVVRLYNDETMNSPLKFGSHHRNWACQPDLAGVGLIRPTTTTSRKLVFGDQKSCRRIPKF